MKWNLFLFDFLKVFDSLRGYANRVDERANNRKVCFNDDTCIFNRSSLEWDLSMLSIDNVQGEILHATSIPFKQGKDNTFEMKRAIEKTQDIVNVQKEGLYHPAIQIRLSMDNIQKIANAVQKGLQLIVWASVQQCRTRLTFLRNEPYNDSLCTSLELRAGKISMLYGNGDGCCEMLSIQFGPVNWTHF